MLPKVGETVFITALPSYLPKKIPSLPRFAKVVKIDPYPYIVVDIDGRKFELYEDDGYEQTLKGDMNV